MALFPVPMTGRPEGESGAAFPSCPSPSRQEADSVSLEGKRVVICEDEGILQMQLRRALVRAGMIVAGSANNGQTAVETVLQERPDIVLMDIRMPLLDGLEASRRILSVYRPCLVVLTAYADQEYQDQAKALGASGYIIKPITNDALFPQLEAAWEAYTRA